MASAKEYYAKYKDRLAAHRDRKTLKVVMDDPEEASKAIQELMREFIQESKQIIDEKNLRNDRSVMALINTQNNKWNSLCACFELPVLKKDSYKRIVYKMLGIDQAEADAVRRGGPVPAQVPIPEPLFEDMRRKFKFMQ